ARRLQTHASFMIAAVFTSSAFLVCYLVYHAKAGHRSSNLGLTVLGITYYSILISHLILAIVIVPLIVRVLWLAYRRRWEQHRKLARPTFWLWLYVSVTGVIIYWMLYHLIPTIRGGAS